MALNQSPRIVTDGLIFAIDTDNAKSYKGPAITNILNQITQIGTGTAAGYSFTASTETVYIPQIGTTTVKVNSGYNNYSAVSTNCCPALFAYGSGLSVSPSTLYTYGILYKATSGYTHPNYMYRYEYTGAGAYVTEAGVHSTTNRVHLGDGWYWAWGTFTTSATTATVTTYSFYYNYGTAVDNLYVAKVFLTQGDYTKLHPRFWPDVNTSRASTSAVFDLTGRNTITASSLTYANTGSFSFNGSSNQMIFPENTDFNTQTPSIEVWVKTGATTQNGFWFEKGTVNSQYALFQEGANITWRLTTNVASLTAPTSSYMNTTQFAQVVGTYTAGDRRIYVNGKQVASDALNYTIPTNTNGCSIGVYGGFNGSRGYYYNGSIAIVRVYNRALSSNEVLQNFNALRGRFGL